MTKTTTTLSYRNLRFAKRCTNDFGRFRPGDKARGAFPAALLAEYVRLGILVPVAASAASAAAAVVSESVEE